MKFKVWSNFLFLVPLYLAFSNHVYWYTLVLGLVTISSVCYHVNNEKRYKYIDLASSLGLIASNFFFIFNGHLNRFGVTALMFGFIALVVYFLRNKNNYNFTHGVWHILSAIICYLSFLAFI